MSGSNASRGGEPRWTRALRFVTGAAMAGVLVPAAVRLAMFVGSAWRDSAGSEAYDIVAAVFVAVAVLGGFGLSLVVHAIRGTRPKHPLLPFLVAVPILLGVSVHRAGGLGPIVAGEQGVAVSQLLSLAVIAVALAVHVVVHELGHVAAARVVGSRLESLRLGPIAVRRVGDRFRVEKNRLRLRGVLGSALSIPTKEEGFERAYAVTILGGPAATIALTLLSWAGARVVSPPASDAEAIASFVLWHSTFVGVFLAVMNLVPMRLRSGMRNDGSRAWMALRARTEGAREALRFTLNSTQGRRPRDWDRTAEALVAAAETDTRYAPEVRLAALGVALDTGDLARAGEILMRGCGIDRPEDGLRQEFLLQEALLAALVRGDAAAARARLAEVGSTPLREYPLLAHAAAALAEGRNDEARTLLARWKEATERSGVPGLRVGNEWAEELLEARLA